jgi:hypothetical protein
LTDEELAAFPVRIVEPPTEEELKDGWELSDGEFRQLRDADAAERYEFFVRAAVKHQVFWILAAGNEMACAGDRAEYLPVWPHPRFAREAAARTPDWEHYAPEAIELREWELEWMPGLADQGRSISVFPVDGHTTHASLERLWEDIREATFAN